MHAFDTHHDAATGGVRYYQLDNEMMLWPSTHHDIRANPVDSDEVWDKTVTVGVAVKSADPSAFLLGYTAWYALDLFVSGKDTAESSDADQKAHGGVPVPLPLGPIPVGYEVDGQHRQVMTEAVMITVTESI